MIPVIYVVIIVMLMLALFAGVLIQMENRIRMTEKAVSRLIVRISKIERGDRGFDR